MAASSALPVVDLAPFFASGEEDDAESGNGVVARDRATEAVREACLATGFFRVVNHGVPRELMARALQLSAAFFALPDEEKAKARSPDASAPLPVGYARQPAHSADKNEYLLVFNPGLWLNAYPAEPAELREALEECYAKLTDLGLLIQEILNECMGLPAGFLASYNSDRPSFDFLAALRYFPMTSAEDDSNGLSAHEDGNIVTFLLQDDVGGLEVLGDNGWSPAEPVEGSIVVNVGDVVQVLSNGKFRSATHRVVRKPGAPPRHSLAFFLTVHGDTWVEPLPEFAGGVGQAPRYRGFRYREYQQLRLRNQTHPPSRPEDVVHITHYAI